MTAGVPSEVSMLEVPSIMKLFEVGRAPWRLTALPAPCRMTPCSPLVSTAPAFRNSSCRKFRPFRGRSVICFAVITWPTVAVSVSRATAAACTSTASVNSPVCKSRSMRTTWSTFRRTPVRLAGRKPWSDAVTEYVLTGSRGIT